MTSKKLGRLLVMLMTMLVAVVCFGNARQTTVTADAATVSGYGTPTADPDSFLLWYTNTGFRLQPQDEYTTVGQSKTLTSAVGYSFLDTFFNPLAYNHFQWYQSTDAGAHWSTMSGQTSSNLTVTPSKAGTTYYQESFGYYLFIPPLTPDMYYYSRVASVTTLGDPVNATNLSVKADDTYLYNNQDKAATTTVYGTPTPADATGDITWSSSDANLATVNKTSGAVTANTAGRSGTVTITGTIKNDDGTTETGSVDIKIGGGLDDQTVNSGKAATFSIQGSFAATPKSVVWYKQSAGSSTATQVASGTSLTYTTPTTTSADNKAQYYAKITIASDSNTKTITTNAATLNVMFSYSPKVSFTNKITNLTDSTGDTPTLLSNVIAGDQCEISGSFIDSNPDTKMKTATFKILLPANIENTPLVVGGKTPGLFEYATEPGPNDSEVYVEFKNIPVTPNQSIPFDVKFTSDIVTDGTFQTVPLIVGYDAQGNELGTYTGNTNLTVKTSNNALTTKAAGEVTFGSLSYANIDQNITGQVVGGGDLLNVTDNRRTKTGTTITLQQEAPFSDGTNTLNATLSYNSNGMTKALNNQAQDVLYSGPGIKVGSLNANNGDKLLLNIPSQAIYPGEYSSTLLWTITSAPS
ncbi:hypothetical protein [Levilactobacillus yiduensis]|uniref:hypothetical protein n=1 Tax=Levilactobacillus yiduensis TaxID=2953880 RepID=UPI000EF2AE62|nr:hypothetical protein [Levilactobacillus yiduensis]AYM01540.1 hypothetical protein D8911_00485 [Levilactobacillus brevis]